MSVYVIWESHFSRENAPAGLETTKAIWRDMESFDGYLDHQLLHHAVFPVHARPRLRSTGVHWKDGVVVTSAGERLERKR